MTAIVLAAVLSTAPTLPVSDGIEKLLHMAKALKARPDFMHHFNVDRIEDAK